MSSTHFMSNESTWCRLRTLSWANSIFSQPMERFAQWLSPSGRQSACRGADVLRRFAANQSCSETLCFVLILHRTNTNAHKPADVSLYGFVRVSRSETCYPWVNRRARVIRTNAVGSEVAGSCCLRTEAPPEVSVGGWEASHTGGEAVWGRRERLVSATEEINHMN